MREKRAFCHFLATSGYQKQVLSCLLYRGLCLFDLSMVAGHCQNMSPYVKGVGYHGEGKTIPLHANFNVWWTKMPCEAGAVHGDFRPHFNSHFDTVNTFQCQGNGRRLFSGPFSATHCHLRQYFTVICTNPSDISPLSMQTRAAW